MKRKLVFLWVILGVCMAAQATTPCAIANLDGRVSGVHKRVDAGSSLRKNQMEENSFISTLYVDLASGKRMTIDPWVMPLAPTPTLLSPVPGQVNSVGRWIDFKVKVNDIRTKKCKIEMISIATGIAINFTSTFPVVGIVSNGEFNLRSYFDPLNIGEGDYSVIVTNLGDLPTDIYEQSVYTVQLKLVIPKLVLPVPNSVINIPSKMLNIAFEHNEAAQARIRILSTAPVKEIFNKLLDFKFSAPRPILDVLVQIPGLKPYQKYVIELTTYDFIGIPLGQRSYTFFTGSKKGGKAPSLSFLTNTNLVYLCGDYRDQSMSGDIVVQANDPNTALLRLNVFTQDGEEIIATYSVGPPSYFDRRIVEITSPSQIKTPLRYRLTLPGVALNPVLLTFRLTALDSFGKVIRQTTRSNVRIVAQPMSQVLEPIVIYPQEGQIQVSVQPKLETNTIKGHCRLVLTAFYEIDTYPADWQGTDYQKSSQLLVSASQGSYWIPSTPLKPNTTYEWAISYRNPETTYGSTTLRKIIRFTTGSSSLVASARFMEGIHRIGDARLVGASLIMPNTFDQELSIQIAPQFAQTQVRVFAHDGRLLFEKQATGGKTLSFQTENLRTGVYVVQIYDNEGHYEQLKLVKQ